MPPPAARDAPARRPPVARYLRLRDPAARVKLACASEPTTPASDPEPARLVPLTEQVAPRPAVPMRAPAPVDPPAPVRVAPAPNSPERAAATPPAPAPVASARSPAVPRTLPDLPPVRQVDWITKVGAAASRRDVIVFFYGGKSAASETLRFALARMLEDVLPQIDRPYVVYRFFLDADRGFVSDMPEHLGLRGDDPVHTAGMLWVGPGRRYSVAGDRAFASRSAFTAALVRMLREQRASLATAEWLQDAAHMSTDDARPSTAPARPDTNRSAGSAWLRRVPVVLGFVLGVAVLVGVLFGTVSALGPTPAPTVAALPASAAPGNSAPPAPPTPSPASLAEAPPPEVPPPEAPPRKPPVPSRGSRHHHVRK